MPSPKTRRYSIEIKDPDNKPVLFTALDWTDEERLIAVAQIMRVAGLPDDSRFTAPAAKLNKGPWQNLTPPTHSPAASATPRPRRPPACSPGRLTHPKAFQ